MGEPCPTCGTTTGALQNQPLTDDPAVLDRLADALRRRLDAVREERARPEDVQDEVSRLCVGLPRPARRHHKTGLASRDELIQHLALHLRQIEARLEAMEQSQAPNAEHSPRLPGPGDRATG